MYRSNQTSIRLLPRLENEALLTLPTGSFPSEAVVEQWVACWERTSRLVFHVVNFFLKVGLKEGGKR